MPLSPFGKEIGTTRQYRFLLLIFGVPIYHNTVMNDFGQWYFAHKAMNMTINNDADNMNDN